MPGTLESLFWDLKLGRRARLSVVPIVLKPLCGLFALVEDDDTRTMEEEDLRPVTLSSIPVSKARD